MGTSNDEFRANLALGRSWELAVGRWLQSRGWFLLPVYDYSGLSADKAPRLQGDVQRLTVPDLLAAHRDKQAAWVEVKYRKRAVLYRIQNERRTGLVPEHLWNDYLEVEAVTGMPVWLVFIQDEEGEVVGRRIGELRDVVQMYWAAEFGRTQVFIPYDRLTRLAGIEDIRRFWEQPVNITESEHGMCSKDSRDSRDSKEKDK